MNTKQEVVTWEKVEICIELEISYVQVVQFTAYL